MRLFTVSYYRPLALLRNNSNADKRVNKYVKEKAPGSGPVRFRITIEDIADYGDEAPEKPWTFKIDSEIRRR